MKTFFKKVIAVCIIGVFLNPILSVQAEEEEISSLESEAAILINADTGDVLYEKNSHKKMYPASITKIISGIMAIEQGNLGETVNVSKRAREADGTRVYLLEEEEVTLKKLLQGMLINSGNDAAIAIAEHLGGSVEQFAEEMNAFMENKIDVKNSHFTNPHGLFDENHYTTAADMAKVSRYAMQNETFREIVGTKELEWIGEGWETTLYNHNRMLWNYEGTTGIKNGFVSQSRFTLVTAVKRGGSEFIAVTLKANTKNASYRDMKKMFDYAFKHYETRFIAVDKQFTSVDGTNYGLESETAFMIKKGERFKITVSEFGELVITGEDGRVVLSKPLKVIEKRGKKRNIASAASLYEENEEELSISTASSSSNGLLFVGIGIFCFILIIVSIVYVYRKHLLRKKQKNLLNEVRNYINKRNL
ncbi:D-alanyl-D-alanine carboxypeptidase family protein [Bacillus taeanensis]|uniref:D-alanyl-D-alanine carboxypeptidase n=1 Tax=Bacillus taeanensis TaxID=273032 RepID=A0A366XPK8_9BACI|nr:D-alanyl-D-alanine carboxypeptidase family protein [Bacillus taeanensis]RBW67837.1 D-alanyl-D-alanine carboxypeptidase [Bacillus taeanensis]